MTVANCRTDLPAAFAADRDEHPRHDATLADQAILWSRPMLLYAIVIASAVISILIPFIFVTTRESTKLHRQGIVSDLSTVFEKQSQAGSFSIPSFEFVKYKYFIDVDLESRPGRRSLDFASRHWVLSSIPFIIITFALNVICAAIVVHSALRLPVPIGVGWLAGKAPLPLFAWVLLASYVGGMLFTLRSFNQAINNFDFSPFSLIGACVNLTFAIASGFLLIFGVFGLPMVFPFYGLAGPATFPFILLAAFAAGYFPDVAVRNIVRWSKLRLRKTEFDGIYDSFKVVPLEIIDGIDSEIRSRLEDYHISTVQNLAAANPLMLFVETPYGVYQVMDWVAQAQLCASVGPKALRGLWDLGIRTIFDLERVLLDPACNEPELILAIGAVIWKQQMVGQQAPSPPPSLAAIKADIRFRLENPHVRRLRQIFIKVGESLGRDSQRLPPLLDCPVPGRCPFSPPRRTRSEWPHRKRQTPPPSRGRRQHA